jgi:predicted helicase
MFNEYRYKMPEYFPTGDEKTLLLCISGQSSSSLFSALVTDMTPNRHFMEVTMILPFSIPSNKQTNQSSTLFDSEVESRSNISDWAVQYFSDKFGRKLTRTEIFEYVYGVLNSKEYIERYAADLRKDVPRIPLLRNFEEIIKVGRDLIELHVNYESLPEFGTPTYEMNNTRIEKIKFGPNKDKTKIILSTKEVINDIPLEAYDYLVNGKTPIEWIIDRYQIRKDADTGIENDPNDWDSEVYVSKLLRKIITLSLETVKLRGRLPAFSVISD